MFRLIIKPGAEKRFAKFNKSDQNRIISALNLLVENPYQNSLNIKKLIGTKGKFYRIRLGDIRIIYEIVEGFDLVNIRLIDFRGNVY